MEKVAVENVSQPGRTTAGLFFIATLIPGMNEPQEHDIPKNKITRRTRKQFARLAGQTAVRLGDSYDHH